MIKSDAFRNLVTIHKPKNNIIAPGGFGALLHNMRSLTLLRPPSNSNNKNMFINMSLLNGHFKNHQNRLFGIKSSYLGISKKVHQEYFEVNLKYVQYHVICFQVKVVSKIEIKNQWSFSKNRVHFFQLLFYPPPN